MRAWEICHQHAVFLENLWTLHNMREAERRRIPLDRMERPLIRVKNFTMDLGYFILIGYSLEPPENRKMPLRPAARTDGNPLKHLQRTRHTSKSSTTP